MAAHRISSRFLFVFESHHSTLVNCITLLELSALCARSLHTRTHTLARTAQRTSQVADVNAAVRALRAPPQEPFFNKHTHTLPTSALLLSKHKQTVSHRALGGGQLENNSLPIMTSPFWLLKPSGGLYPFSNISRAEIK